MTETKEELKSKFNSLTLQELAIFSEVIKELIREKMAQELSSEAIESKLFNDIPTQIGDLSHL